MPFAERQFITMKIGICTKPERLEEVLKFNFDYAELSFNSIAALSDAEFDEVYKKMQHLGIKSEAFNGYFGKDIALYGKDSDPKAIAEYSDKAMKRAKLLGGEVVVLGSGGARNIPESISREEAILQFRNVIRICGDTAKKYGIKIAIEPLSYRETNYINTLTDGIEATRGAAHPSVGVLVDFFHFYMNGENVSEFKDLNGELLHAHIARPNPSRGLPRPEDANTIATWSAALRSVGYDSRISFEGRISENREAELKAARPLLEIFR